MIEASFCVPGGEISSPSLEKPTEARSELASGTEPGLCWGSSLQGGVGRRKAGLGASPSLGSSGSEPPCRAGDRLLRAVWGDSAQESRRKQFLEGKTGGTPLFDLESLFAVCDQDSAPQSWSLCLLILALWVLRAPLSFLNTQGCPLSHYCCSLLSQLNRISPVSPLCTKLFSRFLLFLWCICLEEVFSSFQVSCAFFKVHFLLCSAILCLPGWIFSSFIIL